MAATVNQCSLHHFSSEYIIDKDFWDTFIEAANNNDYERNKLINAQIRFPGSRF